MRKTISLSTFAKRMKGLRKAKGLNQPELALRAGVTKALISQIENGTTKEVKMVLLFKLADALEVSARFLATGNGSPLQPGVITTEQIALLTAFRSCKPAVQAEVIAAVEMLSGVQAQAPHPARLPHVVPVE